MASCSHSAEGTETSHPAARSCRVIRVDLRRARVASLAEQVRQGRYAVDVRRLASDLLRLEPAICTEAESLKA